MEECAASPAEDSAFTNNNDFYKIIAVRFGGMILFAQNAIDRLKQTGGEYDQILSLAEFKMMSRLDLGDKWGKYAEHAPVLFEVPKETTIHQRNPHPYSHRIF